MNELVFIQNEQAITTSLKVAEVFEKRHDHVMRDIRDGFTELVGNMNGVKVREWKRKYFAAFNRMENALIELLAERKSAEYLKVRNATKIGYKKLAETIQQVLVPLAREQGSDTDDKFFYINYARSINKRLGIKSKSREYPSKDLPPKAKIFTKFIAVPTKRLKITHKFL